MSARGALALTRASWRTARSYRLSYVLSFASLLVPIVPVYFIATALEPFMGTVIAGEGRDYFGFVLVGTVALTLVAPAITSVGAAMGGGVSSGFLEALTVTPAGLATLVAGQVGYPLAWAAGRAALLVAVGVALGGELMWGRLPEAVLAMALIVAAYLGLGLAVGALVVGFRTTAAIPQAAILLSTLMGGVYFPTTVLPDLLRPVAGWIPLTPGLRAVRRSLLEGAPISAIAADLGVLAVMAVGLVVGGAVSLRWAFARARRTGSLSQY